MHSFIELSKYRILHQILEVRQICGILLRKSTNDHVRRIYQHIQYDYFRCASSTAFVLNTLGFNGVTITYSVLEYLRILVFLRSEIWQDFAGSATLAA